MAERPAARFGLVVFDLDGTLIDTRRDLAESTNALIAELGGHALDVALIASMVGQSVDIWLARALTSAGITPFPPDALERFSAIYDEHLLNHTQVYASVPQALEHAATIAPLAVLTNKEHNASIKILDALGLAKFFMQVIGLDGTTPPKPAPDGLLALMKQAGTEGHHTLLVGDSPIDMQTARNAAAHICVARYGFGYVATPSEELQSDELFIDHPSELAALLDNHH